MRIAKFALALFIAVGIASCGWQLRNSSGIDSETGTALTKLYVGTKLPTHQQGPGSILRILDRRLNDLDIASVKTLGDAQLGIVILSEAADEDVLSLTSDLFEQQTRLSKTVEYQVWRGDKLLVDLESVTTFRDQTQDQSRAAAKNREADLIFDEINLDLVNQMIRRLQLHNAIRNENQT